MSRRWAWSYQAATKHGGQLAEENSREKQVSGTAMATAFVRALAAHDPRKEIRGQDYLAEIFLDEDQKKPLRDPSARRWVMANRLAPGAYEFMLARTAFFDRLVEHALKENIAQVVLSGAGYDSRPYRFREVIQATRIFELDAPPTQQRKQACLQRAGIPISGQIHYVAIDFEKDDWRDALLAAGFDRAQPALFIWEGVTYYLSGAAVDRMLAFVRSHSPFGSSIGFDYAALSAAALSETGAQELRQHLQSKYSSEPAKFGIPSGQIEAFLAGRGFGVLEHLTAADMDAKYLSPDSHSRLGQVPSLFCLVHAMVTRNL